MIIIPKFFATSDIHSFYTPFKKALDEAGFDPNNKEHWLVVCGDCFDRGGESEDVLRFLMSLERKILVKGNHDILLEECCMREFPYSHDNSNGTCKTIQDLGGAGYGRDFAECCCRTWDKLARYRELLVNYFETEKYIFVHSWIPIISQGSGYCKYDENWRKATDSRWEDALWGNPFDMHFLDLNQTGKTIVFGHWHCSGGHKMLGHCKSEFDEDAIWEPCFAEGIIGIDRCTAHTGECNVVVLEDEFI